MALSAWPYPWPYMTLSMDTAFRNYAAARRFVCHCYCMQLARSLPLHVFDQLTPGNDQHADVKSSRAPRCQRTDVANADRDSLIQKL